VSLFGLKREFCWYWYIGQICT